MNDFTFYTSHNFQSRSKGFPLNIYLEFGAFS